MDDLESERELAAYTCPQCGATVDAPADPSANLLVCPRCGHQFFIGGVDEEDESLEEEKPDDHDEELDGLRIRQLATLRRASIRSRTYWMVGAVASLTLACQLLFQIGRRIYYHVPGVMKPVGYGLFVIVAFWAFVYCTRRMRELQQEIETSALEEPTDEPDFTQLSDGSQHAKNLEDIR